MYFRFCTSESDSALYNVIYNNINLKIVPSASSYMFGFYETMNVCSYIYNIEVLL